MKTAKCDLCSTLLFFSSTQKFRELTLLIGSDDVVIGCDYGGFVVCRKCKDSGDIERASEKLRRGEFEITIEPNVKIRYWELP